MAPRHPWSVSVPVAGRHLAALCEAMTAGQTDPTKLARLADPTGEGITREFAPSPFAAV
jgi:hypothetical protein